MKGSEDYFLEDLLGETEKELEELETFEGNMEGEENEEGPSNELRKQFLAEENEGIDFKIDGYAELDVSDNRMEVHADFYPPSEGKKLLEFEDVMFLLEKEGIKEGIDWQAIKDSLFECSLERKPVKNVSIARGKRPEAEVPAHYVLEKKLSDKKSGIDGSKARINYREVSPFTIVHEGEVLARRVEKKEGVFGVDVFGKKIPFETSPVQDIEAGKNTKAEGGVIVSLCEGIFDFEDAVVAVNEVLHINRNVDYSTGNINFPGDVIIQGLVQDGFSVRAGGSIYCSQSMDASEVECEKNLLVKQGLIGRKKGKVRVAGHIKTKFIENCFVEAVDSVYVETGILNSAVHTTNRVELGKKGMIIGGTVYAQNGVITSQIGSPSGPATEIYCGVDYRVKNKLDWINDNNMKLAGKLNQVEMKLQKSSGEAEKQLNALRDKLKTTIHKLNENANNLVYKLDKNESAEVVVRGKVYPGVYIDICHVSHVVGREMSNVRFKLNMAKGKIIAENNP